MLFRLSGCPRCHPTTTVPCMLAVTASVCAVRSGSFIIRYATGSLTASSLPLPNLLTTPLLSSLCRTPYFQPHCASIVRADRTPTASHLVELSRFRCPWTFPPPERKAPRLPFTNPLSSSPVISHPYPPVASGPLSKNPASEYTCSIGLPPPFSISFASCSHPSIAATTTSSSSLHPISSSRPSYSMSPPLATPSSPPSHAPCEHGLPGLQVPVPRAAPSPCIVSPHSTTCPHASSITTLVGALPLCSTSVVTTATGRRLPASIVHSTPVRRHAWPCTHCCHWSPSHSMDLGATASSSHTHAATVATSDH